MSSKLKAAMQNISVDVFGYEAKVTANILEYFENIAVELEIPRERVVLRIFNDDAGIQTKIYKEGKIAKKISVAELITIFTKTAPSPLFSLEEKTTKNIQHFISDYANAHGIISEEVQLCILTGAHQVWIVGYSGAKTVGNIPLKTLIKHFMA